MVWDLEMHKRLAIQGRVDNHEAQSCPFRRGKYFVWPSECFYVASDCGNERNVGESIGVVIRVAGSIVVKEVLEAGLTYCLVAASCKSYQVW